LTGGPKSVVRCQRLIIISSCAEQQAHHGETEEGAHQPLSERAEGSDPGCDEEGCKSHKHGALYSSDTTHEYVVWASKQNSSQTALRVHHTVPSVGDHIDEKSCVLTGSCYNTKLVTIVSVFRN
jgi:ABC-type Zn2+ transport system substrate-binding protein/surface adhesin